MTNEQWDAYERMEAAAWGVLTCIRNAGRGPTDRIDFMLWIMTYNRNLAQLEGVVNP